MKWRKDANEKPNVNPWYVVYLFMEALVLERKGELSIREIVLPTEVGAHDVKISIHIGP
jgi:hypothetical protein